jgi:hypothetical protein
MNIVGITWRINDLGSTEKPVFHANPSFFSKYKRIAANAKFIKILKKCKE